IPIIERPPRRKFRAIVEIAPAGSSSPQGHRSARSTRRGLVASVSTYLNFPGNTEAAFLFYRSVFGTGFDSYGIMRMGDVPPDPGQPPLSEADSRLVMHVCLPILGGHLLMGTDCVASRGQT